MTVGYLGEIFVFYYCKTLANIVDKKHQWMIIKAHICIECFVNFKLTKSTQKKYWAKQETYQMCCQSRTNIKCKWIRNVSNVMSKSNWHQIQMNDEQKYIISSIL